MDGLPRLDTVAAARLLFAPLADSRVERAAAAFLDPQWRLLGRHDTIGGPDAVMPSIRDLVRQALRLDAARLILAHNHPSGNAEPSPADLAFTRTLARVLAPLEIALVDHLIVTPSAITSLRDRGLL